jgi:hypothetical protein
MIDLFMMSCCAVSAIPAVMVACNLRHYQPLGRAVSRDVPAISVLIPARNEAGNIRAAVESVLHCEGAEFEVLVWDDSSTDGTAAIVRELELKDSRVRLIEGSPPPDGWAGKPYGCWKLASHSKGEILVFLDADVRLRPGDSLSRMASAFLREDLALLSGIPWQRVETLSEVMIVPLIHFILLGFLPLQAMRASTDPRFAAACGQLMVFRRSSYFEVGGHELAKGSFHEGLALSRAFRNAGRTTDLFDASDVAVCRMYSGFLEVWRGFAKNAHEGMASPKSIWIFSFLLLVGHVAPALGLLSGKLENSSAHWALLATCMGLLSRVLLCIRFKQPITSLLLHPLSVALLLCNQWYGGLRFRLGRPVAWRGRASLGVLLGAMLSASAVASVPQLIPPFELEDQGGVLHHVDFPRTRPMYIVAAARSGTGHIAPWVKPVVDAFGDRVEILGLADVRGVPSVFHGAVRFMIRDGTRWPVLLDWNATVIPQMCKPKFSTEVFVVDCNGVVCMRSEGEASASEIKRVSAKLEALISQGRTRRAGQ